MSTSVRLCIALRKFSPLKIISYTETKKKNYYNHERIQIMIEGLIKNLIFDEMAASQRMVWFVEKFTPQSDLKTRY